MMATLVRDTLREAMWPSKRLVGTLQPFDTEQMLDETPSNLQAPPDDNNSPTQNLFMDPAENQRAEDTKPHSGPSKLNVSIHGGEAPYKLMVTQEGRTVASARVPEARSVSLRVPSGTLTVRVEDASGKVEQIDGRASIKPVGVVFP